MAATSVSFHHKTSGQGFRKGQVVAGLGACALLVFGAGASGAWAVTTPVDLGTATSYSALAATTVTNTGPTTLSGNVGVSPGSAVTGFPPGITAGTIHAADAAASSAEADALTAYNDASGRTFTSAGQTDLGGLTLTPGAYNTGGVITITGALTLNAQGNPNAIFVFKSLSTLITASASSVVLTNGAQACNVFWIVGSSATLGTGSTFVGSILANTSVTVTTNVDIKGRAIALNGATTLDSDTFTSAACAASPSPSPSGRSTGSALPNTGASENSLLMWGFGAAAVIAVGVAFDLTRPRRSTRPRK